MANPNILNATTIQGFGYSGSVPYWSGSFGSMPSSAYIAQNAASSGKIYRVNNFTVMNNNQTNIGNARYQLNSPTGNSQGTIGLSANEIVRLITADAPWYVMEGQSITVYRTINTDIRYIISMDVIS